MEFFQMTIANKPATRQLHCPRPLISPPHADFTAPLEHAASPNTPFLIDTPAIRNHPNSLKTIGGDHV
jgi:hypothetical protein